MIPQEEHNSASDHAATDTALLAAILNTAVDAIITIDERGNILNANRALQKLFGYLPSELIGKNISCLMPEPDRSSHDGYLAKYQQTGKAAIIGIGRQVMGQRRDGSLIPVDLAVSEIQVGNRKMYTGIVRDMTERHQVESDLRTAQQRLIQSERLTAIGQMMTGLAHESRNALQRSRACLDMLELDLHSSPDQHDLVKRTRSALVELQVLYEEVRSYAAPIQLDRSRQYIGELCEETWLNLREQWQTRQIDLVASCDACPPVSCDKQRICQVLRNIFENSLAVSPNGSSIFVDCRTIQRDQSSFAQISITDQGPGLNDEQRLRMFEPFYTTKTRGTGLGMAICHRIIDSHGGRIFVGTGKESDNEKTGAVIVVELPVG
ncbi:MAG: PAS domain S-box protein [Planctomycetota bacterium]|nr:PAS domain S-box protein [Planctomycetota bacterium]